MRRVPASSAESAGDAAGAMVGRKISDEIPGGFLQSGYWIVSCACRLLIALQPFSGTGLERPANGFAERGFEQALPDAFTVDQAPHAPSAVRPTTPPNRRPARCSGKGRRLVASRQRIGTSIRRVHTDGQDVGVVILLVADR